MPRLPKKPSNPSASLARLVYERYDRELQRFLLRRSDGGRQSARDLAQEVYLRMLRVDDATLLHNPQGYMYRIASHVVYESLLKTEMEPVTFDSEIMASAGERPSSLPADTAEAQLEIHAQLKAALTRLPPVYRQVILLHKREGLSYKEVAQQLGLSVHTVKKYVFRALAQVRAMRLKRHGGQES